MKDYKAYEKPIAEQNRLDLQIEKGASFTKNIIQNAFEDVSKNAIVFDFGCFNGNSTKAFFASMKINVKG